MSKKIFWIASYPKSGNTWMRAIITSFFFTKNGEFNFDLLKNVGFFDVLTRYKFIEHLNNNDFNNLHKLAIISKYRLKAQKRVRFLEDFSFFKTHNANITINNYKYTNEENTLGVIYLVRDPRDVVLSYANHQEKDIDMTIDHLLDKRTITRDKYRLPTLLSSWDLHYESWKKLKVPKMIIKYEDLLKNTKKVMEELSYFFEQNYNFKFINKEFLIDNIISSTKFNIFKKYEENYGFQESKGKSIFFKKGKSNQWKKKLQKKQVEKIESSLNETMTELNYI